MSDLTELITQEDTGQGLINENIRQMEIKQFESRGENDKQRNN